MEISITRQYGQIGISYTQSQMEITSNVADMKIAQVPPEIDIFIDFPQIDIDLTETLADIGYKGVVAFSSEQAYTALGTVLQGIGRTAREGDIIAHSVGRGPKVFSMIAWNNSFDNTDFNVDAIPHIPPKISATGGMQVDYQPGQVNVDVPLDFFPKINAAPGTVKIYLEKEPMITVEVVGSYLDLVI
ncbi:MAG: hypothetical protein CVV03_07690 [Firmicutes bacterium HGW-Firmicutes-8]|nr:MAG: hypothetical protein CVV03_07690 [Firmicutes bacterium HGW-Firmicutes-8]